MADDEKVIVLDCLTKLDIPVERILHGAVEAEVDSIVVLGWTKAGGYYFASSRADGADIIYLMEMAKKKLLEIGDV